MDAMEMKKAKILKMLATNNHAVEKALIALYRRQTTDEKQNKDTVHRNGRGFNYKDAQILSSFAEKILHSKYPIGDRLTAKQFQWARRLVPKYWRQLAEEADLNRTGWENPLAIPVLEVKDASPEEMEMEADAEAAFEAKFVEAYDAHYDRLGF